MLPDILPAPERGIERMPKRQVRLALLRLGGGVLLNPNERAIGGGPGKA